MISRRREQVHLKSHGVTRGTRRCPALVGLPGRDIFTQTDAEGRQRVVASFRRSRRLRVGRFCPEITHAADSWPECSQIIRRTWVALGLGDRSGSADASKKAEPTGGRVCLRMGSLPSTLSLVDQQCRTSGVAMLKGGCFKPVQVCPRAAPQMPLRPSPSRRPIDTWGLGREPPKCPHRKPGLDHQHSHTRIQPGAGPGRRSCRQSPSG